MHDKVYLVYGLICPINKQIRYIGQSHNWQYRNRIKAHKNCKIGKHGEWIQHLKKSNKIDELKAVIIENNVNDKLIYEREIYWINKYRLDGYDLTNRGRMKYILRMITFQVNQLIQIAFGLHREKR